MGAADSQFPPDVVRTDTAGRKLELYEAHCREHSLEPLDLVY